MKRLPTVLRRLYRILGHAYFHYRAIFDQFEAATSLCMRFHALCALYELLDESLLVIPL